MIEKQAENHSSSEIEAVYRDFCQWRTNKTQRLIPDELWDKVFCLLKTHSMSVVSNKLGLSYQQIQSRQKQCVDSGNRDDSPRFITVSMQAKSQERNHRQISVRIETNNHCAMHCSLTLNEIQLLMGATHHAAN